MDNKKGRLSVRIWTAIIVFMFMGSIAANTETMFLGLFLDGTVFKDGSMGARITLTDTVNLIASLSAVVSGIAAFVMGAISERMKNRKKFISSGFIIWGIVMLIFSTVKRENVSNIFGFKYLADTITVTAVIVILFSLILAFLRSTTNDTAFNSWVTDVSTPQTSAKIETAYTIMGLVTTGIITVLVSNAQTGKMEYSAVFVIFGILAIIIGILGFWLIEEPCQKTEVYEADKETSYLSDIFYGFKPSVVKENVNLYLILSSGCLFNCAFKVFYPYLFIYIGSVIIPANEGVNLLSIEVLITIIVVLFTIVSGVILLMKLYTINKALSFIPSVICLIIGLLIVSTTKNIVGFIAGFGPALLGYIIIMIQFGATVRDNIPKDKVGLFQGIRMIFLIFIPSIIGPTLGNIAAKNSDVTYMSNGAVKVLPTEAMFLYSAVVAVLIFIPMLLFLKKDKEKIIRNK